MKTTAPSAPSLRLRVTATAETIVRGGHPWVFAQSVREQNRPGRTGELAIIFDRNDRFLAIGLYDEESPIRVRVLHTGKPRSLDQSWWQEHAARAFAVREGLFDTKTTGYRCINGESDGWPGLVLDQYDTTRVLKLYTAAWLSRLKELMALLTGPGGLVLRLSRNIEKVAHDEFGLDDGQILVGPPLDGPVVFLESGLRFEADVVRGQKTGFFLDQRDNRRNVEKLSAGRSVLNVFSYSGGFSLYVARGGATSVCSLDISEHALAAARRNFALNSEQAAVAQCRHEMVQADAFAWLRQSADRRFDVIIIDPPSLAKRDSDKAEALGAYAKLIESGLARLNKDGLLVAASCSAHVSDDEFFNLARGTAQKSGRRFTELQTTRHPADHPASFPEAEYLKCIYLRLQEG